MLKKEDDLYELIQDTIEAERKFLKKDSKKKEIAMEKLLLIKSIKEKLHDFKIKRFK